MPAAKPKMKPAADLGGLTELIDSMRSNSSKMAERIEKLEATVLATVGGAELLERRRACQDWQARKTREIERIGTELKRVTLIVPDLSVLSDEVGSKLTALEASASGEISRGADALAGRTGRLEPEVKAKAASDEVKRLKAEAALLATHEDVEPLRDLAIGGFKEGVAKRIDDLTERSHRDREELEGQVGALALLLEGIGSALEASGASLDAKASEARQFVHRAEKEVAATPDEVAAPADDAPFLFPVPLLLVHFRQDHRHFLALQAEALRRRLERRVALPRRGVLRLWRGGGRRRGRFGFEIGHLRSVQAQLGRRGLQGGVRLLGGHGWNSHSSLENHSRASPEFRRCGGEFGDSPRRSIANFAARPSCEEEEFTSLPCSAPPHSGLHDDGRLHPLHLDRRRDPRARQN